MHQARAWAIMFLIGLTLTGCTDTKPAGYRIAVIPKGLTHEFWQSIHRGAERAAADLDAEGIPTRIVWDGPLKENDALAQIRIMDRRISTGVDGIVLAPQHSQTMVAPVRRAGEHGIPVVIIDSGLDPKARDDGLFVKYVATNNENGGYLAAEHLIDLLKKDGKNEPRLILLRYQVGSESTEQRERGFERYIREHHVKVTWLSNDKYAGATKDTALREATPLVNRFRSDIDGIFCPNESSTNGMLAALTNLGLMGANRKLRLVGFDSSEPLLDAVKRGDIDGLILQDPYKMGYLGVWTLVRHLRGDKIDRRQDFGTGEHLITRDNLESLSTRGLFRPEVQAERQSVTDLRQPASVK
jgi:ribose transport system substrate-binding protein